ncbi:unnamed protein product [Vicia faba]|uniref:RING-type E3 ubiquitin transferase n=1 Tax=Vicia faba TaxID=3906 RepID=A0AAV1BD51_VICFA|nr:unnamed protein product [Vicia faba]
MGGCCCCASKETVLSAPPAYYYYPRASDEHVPLSSHQVGATQTAPVAQEICCDKNNTNSNSVQEPSGDNNATPPKSEELKESECKGQTDLELDSAKDSEIELSKLGEPINLVEEEDGCPICLEEYDDENPKLTTKCDHHYHLACILEWMERSDTCPVCAQALVFSPPIE